MKSFLSNEAIELTKTPDWQLWAPIGVGNNGSFWVQVGMNLDGALCVKMGLYLYQLGLFGPKCDNKGFLNLVFSLGLCILSS